MKRITLLTLSLLLVTTLRAEVTLSQLFSDNMILQQLTDAKIWGSTTRKGATITIIPSWSGATPIVTEADADGEWRTTIPTPAYGGPYSITISDGEEHTINNVLIGEVWIASGQSNMARTLSGTRDQYIENSIIDIAKSRDSQLRIMSVGTMVAQEPQSVLRSQGWREASSGVASGTSATAYYFARMLRECLDIPVGIITAAVGGTSINCWLSEEVTDKYDDVAPGDAIYPYPSNRHSNVLYNAMIHPIAGYTAKGFIWYQGESDITNYKSYPHKMVDLVELWRTMWGDDSMAFYYAQIAPYEYSKMIAPGWDGRYIREAQLKAVDMIPNSGMAVLSDVGDDKNIHPADKQTPGERLALQALAKSYDFEAIEPDGPTLKEVVVEGNEMTLTFNNSRFSVITRNHGPLRDFEVAGEDGNFVEAEARIEAGAVVLSAKTVKEPKYVRYGFKDWFVGTLFNVEGMPASSFRTDDF